MSIINITGIYGNGSYMNLDVQSQLTSDTSTVLQGSTAIYGTCTINDVSVMDTFTTSLSNISNNNSDILTLYHDISNKSADILILYADLSANYHELHDYTDEKIIELRDEGLIMDAVMQVLDFAMTTDFFKKKIWERIKAKWAAMTGHPRFTELLGDVQNATMDELQNMYKVYRHEIEPIAGNIAGIHTEPFTGKALVIKGDTYIYSGNLYLSGDIHKGTFNGVNGAWSGDEKLNDYFVMKGVKANDCLNINATTKLVQLDYDSSDFTLGAAPNNALNLKYKIEGVDGPISRTAANKINFKYDTDDFVLGFGPDNALTMKYKVEGVDAPLFKSAEPVNKINLAYDTTYLDVINSQSTTKWKATAIEAPLYYNATNNHLELNYDTDYFRITAANKLQTFLRAVDNPLEVTPETG